MRQEDTFHIKIINTSASAIFVPEQYDGDYTNNEDTLHFETHHKTQYGTTNYYKYDSIFPFEFYTSRKIEGLVPDSIDRVVQQTYFFNQFRVKPFVKIMPGSSLTLATVYNDAKYATVLKAVYYRTEFLDKEKIEKVQYDLKDFIRYDSLNAQYLTSRIFIRFL
ncbi:MAG: hypothetical protein H7Y86_21980 [Rhizobacter sp.]|nr:hypothetical protein [Ferruginibacter sp.]